MVFPTKEILFDPIRLGGLMAWFYLCLYLLQRYQDSSLIPVQNKKISHLLLLLTGPFYLFVLLIIDVVHRAEENNVSFFEALKISFDKSASPKIIRRDFSGTWEDYTIALLDNSGRHLSEVYPQTHQDNRPSETIELTEEIIGSALQDNATDILIDPACTIRFRIDGTLWTMYELDWEIYSDIVASVKILAGMDLNEKRRPQKGSFLAKAPQGNISFQVTSAGVLQGEKLSLRLVNPITAPPELKQLGLTEEQYKTLKEMISRPAGMILVCGPNDSGRRTTMYALLGCLDFSLQNVITLEDPIKYVLPEASQIQIDNQEDITFPNTLPSILQQDPDVIYLSEIRDEQTTLLALQASQAGHLVLATVHSSSNFATLARLLDRGIKLPLLTTGLSMIISQRLIRKLCDHCKTKAHLDDTQIASLKSLNIDPDLIMEPHGCRRCGGTGYRGRTGIFDILIINDDVKTQLTETKFNLKEMKKYGDNELRKVLHQQGIKLALEGITSLSEVKKLVTGVG